ncbi:acyl-CoA dehydrogenase family protein [Fodinicola feengrottensis]|uniref:acyl-CoA dehydrogenase family protein n=1 Tax=Fodinicola feengrottensis TaxID=435914 RepID=UPI002442D4F5|nr:acyl-CoA dehydrogenase family protein [Fodinicola feengrottensis]
MLGERGDGWKVAMTVLRHERGTSAMGMAAALEKQVRTFARFVRGHRAGRGSARAGRPPVGLDQPASAALHQLPPALGR